MSQSINEIALEITPKQRFDVIDIKELIRQQFGDFLDHYKKSYYCSFHTTAGYFEQSLCSRLRHSKEHLTPFINAFQNIFPSDANYHHDQIQLRTELSESEKRNEPKNADSHLIYMSSGLKNCVKYENKPNLPVYFIDLDGVNGNESRARKTTILGFDKEETVHKTQIAVPVSKHPVDSVNLKTVRSGFFDELNEKLRLLNVRKGKVDICLAPDEMNSSLIVNEYETLLMRHDLAEVLKNPFQFMAQQGKHMLLNPAAIPNKTINYAKYDLVQVFNELMDALKISESVVEKILAAIFRMPASRFFRMKRRISLFVSDHEQPGIGQIILGKYQSPILVQWANARHQTRQINVKIRKFE